MFNRIALCCVLVCSLQFASADEVIRMDTMTGNSSSTDWYQDLVFIGMTNKCCQTWVLSIIASCMVGLTGIFPLFFVSVDCGAKLNQQGGSKCLRLLLSFAVGGLLGDVFLHLLPEAWNHVETHNEFHSKHLTLGLWVLLGMFSFVVIEIMFAASQEKKTTKIEPEKKYANGTESHFYTEKELSNHVQHSCNGNSVYHETYSKSPIFSKQIGAPKHINTVCCLKDQVKVLQNIHISGYLNLMANSIDNFTHGLAVAGSFLIGIKMGMLTTFAILIHEIPHEIGDFAILLKSGFNPWNAAKAQLSTATIGILGAIVALSAESVDVLGSCTSWILPFTSGGFLNIALVNVLPDLMKEKDPWESLKQILCLFTGIGIMALVNIITH